jgi:hypothetical protein
MKKAVALLLVLTMLLTGCGILEPIDPTGSTDTTGTTDGVTPPSGPVKVDFAQSDDVMFTEKDIQTEYSEGNSAVITLDGNSVSCNSSKVNVSGTTVTITGEGTFILRGTLNDGMIIVNAGEKDKPRIVLDGASVTSATSAALYVLQAGKVFVTLAEGKENILANGGSFTAIDENNIDAAVFSKQDLTFNGSGSVTITSPAGHGIVCKDDLIFTGGTYTVHSASHGVDANDSLRMKSGTLTIDAGKDGIHVEDADDAATGFVYVSGGTLDIEAEGDGISAALYAQIENGQINILAGGGYENGESHSSGGFGDFMGGGMGPGGGRPGGRSAESATTDTSGTSMKGLKADGGILISNGMLNIDSADDAIHSDDLFVINGGNVTISSGDDGIHAETDLTITGGTIEIKESYEGLEAVNILISGGKTTLKATDDGLNAAGGMDSSGAGGRDEMFGGGMGGPGRPGGMGGASNGSIVITGGELHVQASGDGLDANGYLEITGGYTVVCGPNQGDTATLDYDTSATISGGVFIGTGAAGMAQTFSANTQGVIAVSVGGGQSSGVKITVSDSNGKELVSYQPELAFSVIIFSTPELISGQSYHVRVGSVEGDITAN